MYVSRTYPSIVPYLKGIHQTLDGWREGRDNDGWRLTHAEIKAAKAKNDEIQYLYPKDAPSHVFPSTRLEDDVNCLISLFDSDLPKVRHVRSKYISLVLYGFSDASGSGFGSTITTNKGLKIRHGIWGNDSNSMSSNYKGLCNIVDTIESEVKSGLLNGTEMFIFTDNMVAESCFYKGTSHSRTLFNLVLRLRKAEMAAGMKLHVIHVAGTRMIHQGTDGVSRGNFLEGVMAGSNMLHFIPLNKNAFERSDTLKDWIKTWGPPNLKLNFLHPQDWFDRSHGLMGGSTNPENIWIPEYVKECNV